MVDLANMSPQAIAAWKRLNEAWGRPIPVSSSYRDPETNKRVGGAKGSQHLHGNAFDIPTAGMSPQEIDALIKAGVKAGFRGFGGYGNSLHFDVGPQRTWGPSYGSDTTPQYLKAALSGAEYSPMNYATPTISTKGGQAVNPDEIAKDATAQSTGGGIFGMLGGKQERPPLRERFRDPNFWNEVALTFHSMSSFPNEQAIRSLQSRVDLARETKKEQEQLNKTIGFFQKMGRDDLVQLAQVSPSAALNLYAQSSKPGYKVVTGAQVNAMYPGANLPEDKLFNQSPTGQITQVGGGGVNIDFGDKAQGKFAEEFAKADAKTLADVFSTGITAQRNIVRLNRLESLLANVGTGGSANIKMVAGNFGINTEGLSDIQAAQALINSLVPEQRPAGSGPMSDADLELFKQSLPRIINQPGANELIIQTLKGVAEYDMKGAEIIQRMRKGELTQAEAYDELMSRQDPLAAFNQSGISGSAQPSQPAQNAPQRRKFDATGKPVEDKS